MLVLSRKIGERIRIGDDVVLTVVRIHGEKVRLGIEAPGSVTIHREEVYCRLRERERAGAEQEGRGAGAEPGGDASLSAGRAGR
jgi:carbon storage regulator